MTICDGCGQPADANHTRERIERLQMATRFRPVHIHTLLIDACPPQQLGDFFYNLGGERTAQGREYFDELAKCAAGAATTDTEAVLAEFQRRGLFLAYAADCPIADSCRARGRRRKICEDAAVAPEHFLPSQIHCAALAADRSADRDATSRRMDRQAVAGQRKTVRRRRVWRKTARSDFSRLRPARDWRKPLENGFPHFIGYGRAQSDMLQRCCGEAPNPPRTFRPLVLVFGPASVSIGISRRGTVRCPAPGNLQL